MNCYLSRLFFGTPPGIHLARDLSANVGGRDSTSHHACSICSPFITRNRLSTRSDNPWARWLHKCVVQQEQGLVSHRWCWSVAK